MIENSFETVYSIVIKYKPEIRIKHRNQAGSFQRISTAVFLPITASGMPVTAGTLEKQEGGIL